MRMTMRSENPDRDWFGFRFQPFERQDQWGDGWMSLAAP